MITIELSEEHGGLQLSINDVDEAGSGHGYRIFGPKFSGGGTIIKRVVLDERDLREIASYCAAGGTVPADPAAAADEPTALWNGPGYFGEDS